jgi:hypothetical protein
MYRVTIPVAALTGLRQSLRASSTKFTVGGSVSAGQWLMQLRAPLLTTLIAPQSMKRSDRPWPRRSLPTITVACSPDVGDRPATVFANIPAIAAPVLEPFGGDWNKFILGALQSLCVVGGPGQLNPEHRSSIRYRIVRCRHRIPSRRRHGVARLMAAIRIVGTDPPCARNSPIWMSPLIPLFTERRSLVEWWRYTLSLMECADLLCSA